MDEPKIYDTSSREIFAVKKKIQETKVSRRRDFFSHVALRRTISP